MSESTYYECCQNFGTHTQACVRSAINTRNVELTRASMFREWQHTCIYRRDIRCAACKDGFIPPSLECWNVIEGEY